MLLFITGALRADDAVPLSGKFFDLTGQAGLPVFFNCNQGVRGGSDGLCDGEIRTVETDYFRKDFTLDLIFQQNQTDEARVAAAIGIGENGHDGGWLKNSLQCQIDGNRKSGQANIVFHHDGKAPKLGSLSGGVPHLLRMQKVGNSLSYLLLDRYAGEDPDSVNFTIKYTVDDFKFATPFLNRLNSAIYLTGNVCWRAVRLQVGGKDVPPGKRADASPAAAIDHVPFYKFTAASVVPGFLARPSDYKRRPDEFSEKGWLPGSIYRSASANYLKSNFTLDLVVDFPPGDRGSFLVGMGENGRDNGNWILNSVCAIVAAPADEGKLYSTFHDFWGMPQFGRLGPDHPGPNLIRMQKQGDTLLFAACADFKDKFDPDFITIIPSLRSQSPYLTAKNGYLFFGDHAVIERMRLMVDGRAIDPAGKPSEADRSVATVKPNVPNEPSPAKKPDMPVAARSDLGPTLALSSDQFQLAAGFGSTLLLLDQNRLRRLSSDGFTVTQTMQLTKNYRCIAERRDYFVAISDVTKSLDLIDNKTLKITRSIQMDYRNRWDLCLNPVLPICYVTVEKVTGDGLVNEILIVDERTGEVAEPEDFIGKYVKITSNGRILFSAFDMIYEKGDRLLFNPNRIEVVPEFGDIDILIAYDVSGGLPRVLYSK